MKNKTIFKYVEIISVLLIISLFFKFRLNEISYGLPYFWNRDEIAFQGSTLSSLGFLTGYFEKNYNPFYASLLNLILIIKTIFINEYIVNSLNIDQIKSKIYFNTELFLYYGRLASVLISSISIFYLNLIFKRLKINILISLPLLITFATSMVLLNVSTVFSKNSSYLLIYLIQLYYLIKYQTKINKFNFKSYIFFGILASLAWGVNYWPAFISIYAIFYLHIFKYGLSNLKFPIFFIIFFFIFGPLLNSFFTNEEGAIHWLTESNELNNFSFSLFLKSAITDVFSSIKIIFASEKNSLLLVIFLPYFLISKHVKFKNNFLIIFFLILEPIILFSFSEKIIPQLRYFAGINSVILILVAIIFNTFLKFNNKYLVIFFLIFNIYVIYGNFQKYIKIDNLLAKNDSFFDFNKNIRVDRSKVFYLIDLNFQESLNQNKYYIKLYDNGLIKKNNITKKFYKHIKQKIKKIQSTSTITLSNFELKENIIYFNYSNFQIKDINLFFDFIKKDFDYVVIEESRPFYLNNFIIQKKIKSFIKENYIQKKILFKNEKILLKSQQDVINYFTGTISRYSNIENTKSNLEPVYGVNYGLYKLN